MRVAIYLKNAIMQQIRKVGVQSEQMVALITRISADQVLSLGPKVSIHAAISLGNIINKKSADE